MKQKLHKNESNRSIYMKNIRHNNSFKSVRTFRENNAEFFHIMLEKT